MKEKAEKTKKKIDEYVDSFTIHGLARVLRAPRFEALIWFLCLSVGVLLVTLTFRSLLVKYFKYEVFNDVRSTLTNKNTMPAMTICEEHLFKENYERFCNGQEKQSQYCHRQDHRQPSKEELLKVVPIDKEKERFNFTKCSSWAGNKLPLKCSNQVYFKPHPRLNYSCVTWNHQGNFSDDYGNVQFQFEFISTLKKQAPRVIAVIHDHRDTEIDFAKKIRLDPNLLYNFKVNKKKIIRQPAPYPSKCINKNDLYDIDILPGAYSRRTCSETYKVLNTFKECGDSYDYVRPFIPDHIKRNHQGNKTIDDTLDCIKRVISQDPPKEQCPFPCREQIFEVFPMVSSGSTDSMNETVWKYEVVIQLANVDFFSVLEEIPKYNIPQMLSETGGLFGLVIGASALSFLELLIYLCLLILVRIQRFIHYLNKK